MNFEDWGRYGTHNESPCRDMYEDWENDRVKRDEYEREQGDIIKDLQFGNRRLQELVERLESTLEWIVQDYNDFSHDDTVEAARRALQHKEVEDEG